MIVTILIGVVVFSFIVLCHELGHFVTAKISGVNVEEFGIGFPPRLTSFNLGETRYSINAIPFGGFVKLSGEEDPEVPGSLAGKKRGIRLLVLGAGSMANILLALVLFSTAFLFPRAAATGEVQVVEVVPYSPAALAGMEPGDIILSVNEQPVDTSDGLAGFITENLGREITMLIKRPDSTIKEIQLTPRINPPENEGAVGIAMMTIKRYPIWQVIPLGAGELVNAVVIWGGGLASLFTSEVSASFIGPVGLAQLTGEVARFGPVPLLNISALISLILGIMNLLPLPAIDGGRITFLFLELVRRGKRIPPKVEGMVHLVGFAMLLLLSFAIAFQDIMRIVSGESLIP